MLLLASLSDVQFFGGFSLKNWWLVGKKISFDLGGKTYDFFCRSLSEKRVVRLTKFTRYSCNIKENGFMEAAKVILENNGLDLYQKTDELMFKLDGN